MPLYEEKLISPLALRYTQEHIRDTFKDGRIVEETVKEITLEPGKGDYDIVLRAPFPTIEIVRYSSVSRSSHACQKHWYTLDNRRLYCLQKVAAAHWPKRVGTIVEILYVDDGSFRKKYDSGSLGQSVTIARSCKDEPLSRWDWTLNVNAPASADEVNRAFDCICDDDKKESVDDLANADETSALARLLAAHGACSVSSSPTVSTAASDPSPSSSASSDRGKELADDERAMAVDEIKRQLLLPGTDGRVKMQDWNEVYRPALGSFRSFVESMPKVFKIVPGKQKATGRSQQFSVALVEDQEAYEYFAAYALEEIEGQLYDQPDHHGQVWIESWNTYYFPQLGSVKKFVESRPDKFKTCNWGGKKFTIQLREEAGDGRNGSPKNSWPTETKKSSGNGKKAWTTVR